MNARERLVVALDRSERDEILRLADALSGVAGMLKIGLQAFVGNGPEIVRALVARGEKVFLDLKFHDIPNTALHAVEEAAKLGASIINVHAGGGRTMLEQCAAAVRRHERRPILLGVTVLTSLSDEDLRDVGVSSDAARQAVTLARLCKASAVDGVVASPNEITAIREACGSDFVILTPGIRSAADASGDQKRTMTAREAVRLGADYIVVGRPITSSANPREAAQRLIDEIA